jgi:hypothetical protein
MAISYLFARSFSSCRPLDLLPNQWKFNLEFAVFLIRQITNRWGGPRDCVLFDMFEKRNRILCDIVFAKMRGAGHATQNSGSGWRRPTANQQPLMARHHYISQDRSDVLRKVVAHRQSLLPTRFITSRSGAGFCFKSFAE